MSQPIMGHGGHLFFTDQPEKTDLVKDVEIVLPVRSHRILFSGFGEEVENVSANQRLGQPSFFSDQPQKTQTW